MSILRGNLLQNIIRIHIWKIDDIGQWPVAENAVFTDHELSRADQFQFERPRHQFLAGRNWLRAVLGFHTQSAAQSLRFRTRAVGKPYLVKPNSNLQFNFSRSEQSCAIAVTHDVPIGIDIEQIRPLHDMQATAAMIFDAEDLEHWCATNDDQQDSAFFRSWARKEAVVKANGCGISGGVQQIKVPVSAQPLDQLNVVKFANKSYVLSDIATESMESLSVALEYESKASHYRDWHEKVPESWAIDKDKVSILHMVREIEFQS